ncbi:MAG: hypothetical protein FJ224_02570 [Lentisphaerae bacterium]|nr:hypothetical protein [Lentisphaerota bacterium]
MNDYDNGDLLGTAGRWGDALLSEVAYAIDAAIQQAARVPISGLAADEDGLPGIREFLGRRDTHCAGEPALPRDADAILLDVLPVSLTAPDDTGRLQIEPDAAALQTWSQSDRESAEHLTSWLNATGTGRKAVEDAIDGGSVIWARQASQYEELLRDTGYDRSNPLVQQESDRGLRDLHAGIEHAREVLDDL